MTGISVLTLLRGRRAHLMNVMRGLAAQDRPPDELIVAVMQPELLADLPVMPFAVRQVLVPGDPLPLARARNAAVAAARGETLVFLDIDCIPDATLITDYAAALSDWDGLLMGEVLYLPKGVTEGAWRFEDLAAIGVRHSDRQGPPPAGIRPCEDYRCFWSLNFALRRRDFDRTGGFDEGFVGYGGEDTDFARTLDHRGVPIGWLRGARVFHQYHPHHMPPVHHLDTILANTRVFKEKWGEYTMGHWLKAFRLMGLIGGEGTGFAKLRDPGPEDLRMTYQFEHMPYVNSARVIRALERDLEADAAATG